MPNHDIHEANRRSWNEATKRHNIHKGDQAAFFRNGGSTLFPDEIDLLGDVRGKTVLHLQCNAGQDTLSIASKLGAVVTGVDISDEAITFAQQLSRDSGIPATFYRADVFDWLAQSTTQYDAVFVSYGVLVWLSDLKMWGHGIANALKPGGRFVLMEFHPLILIFDFRGEWKPEYDYFGGKMIANDGVGDYVGESGSGLPQTSTPIEDTTPFQNPYPSYEFTWGLSDVITVLLDAGLRLTTFREYPYINGWKPFPDMQALPDRRWALPEGLPNLPLMYGLTAQKP